MDWNNWTVYANSVLEWFLGLFPLVIGAMMENPVLGVPVILVIVGLVFRLVLQFIGSLGGNKNSES